MRVHFINVGQANATLLEFRGGTVLIDAGDAGLTLARRFVTRRAALDVLAALVVPDAALVAALTGTVTLWKL